MCWSLVFNPHAQSLQAVPLWSHPVGNLGGVTVCCRIAKALQQIVVHLFTLVLFLKVDDTFWAATDFVLPSGQSLASWIGAFLETVVSDLLGWDLDPNKEDVGSTTQFVGLRISESKYSAKWCLGNMKARQWLWEFKQILKHDSLFRGQASRWNG